MRNAPVIVLLGVVALLLCSGCDTYLGYHYDSVQPDIKQVEKSSSEKQRYWQYQLHGKKLKLFHSVVEEVKIDETKRFSHRRVDTYYESIEGTRSAVKKLGSKPIVTIVIAFPFALVADGLLWIGDAFVSWGKCWNSWQLDEHWPNFMYILGYMPFICVINPFMDAPYMSLGHRRFVMHEPEVYQIDHSSVFREREKLLSPDKGCTLMLNGLKRKLSIGDSGIAEIDLREWLGNKPLIPEFPLELSLQYGWSEVVKLKFTSTQLLDGEELYLLRLARDENAPLSARLKAVGVLRQQGVVASDNADAMVRSLLGCDRFANSIKN